MPRELIAAPNARLAPGERVRHAYFGLGTVYRSLGPWVLICWDRDPTRADCLPAGVQLKRVQ